MAVNPLQQKLVDAIDASEPTPKAPEPVRPAPGVAAAIAEGADINEPLPNSATPLMWAIANQKGGAVRAILDAKPNLAAKDSDGDSATTVAARFTPKDDTTILDMVLGAGANPNARCPNGDPAITWLTRRFNIEGVRVMARHKANLDARTRTQTPIIIEAAMQQAWDVVYTLIEGGADPLVDDEGRRVSTFLGMRGATPPDSPIYPWKVKVWHSLTARGESLAPLPEPS